MNKKTLYIVKIGGNVINNEVALFSFLKDFSKLNDPKILVHGGGKKATELASELGLKPKMIKGRRVTDKANLDIVTMVYAGLLNKKITAQLQRNNCNSIGLSGADANCIVAHKRIVKDIDYGFAGDIDLVDTNVIKMFLQNKIAPVFCAITHDKKGQLLNTNADTIASEIAVAMSPYFQVELNYVFELNGVLENIEDKKSVIPYINLEKYKQLIENRIISEGMIPKLHNCFNALEKGVSKVKIGSETMIKNINSNCTTLTLK
ncbi:MAG: acetylglutamate kinase [Lutibacter sp.]|nr:acetylglutamate kinase [Lutibacter sp.]